MKSRRLIIYPLILGGIIVTVLVTIYATGTWRILVAPRMQGSKTVAERVSQYGEAARKRLAGNFEKVAVKYPPRKLALIGLKLENEVEVWVAAETGGWKHLKTYPILGASGGLGPKLAEGDMQMPEGLYQIESLNPNSAYHLALRVNYPNAFDREKGRLDGRKNLGGDIMIHGNWVSVGCLAMGDEAAEDLFVLAAETGLKNIKVILCPVDFRVRELPADMPKVPLWTPELYGEIRQALKEFPKR